MTRCAAISLLLVAAILEAGGDALMRAGLHRSASWQRMALFTAAALVLSGYGWVVNSPPWDFGRLIGIYVVFFFVVAQLISWLIFKQTPSTVVVIGGTFIVAGGVIISLARA